MNKLLTGGLTLTATLVWAASAGPRTPSGAGRFYPASPQKLNILVQKTLDAVVVDPAVEGEIVALLVPHAGLQYSGPTAAKAYKLLKAGDFDSVIVLGTCHYKELEGAAIYPGAYGTAAGTLSYDAALGARLTRLSPLIRENAAAHKKEYSIEVQIPFLRRVLGPKTKLVAMVMNTQDLETARQVGRALVEAIKGRRVLLVASSDQVHYPSGSIGDAVDRSTLEALKSLDPAYFWLANRFLMNRGLPHLAVTYCGEGAVTAVLEAARALGADSVAVLGHLNSGDVVSEREYNHVVGYAAAAVTRASGKRPWTLELDQRQQAQLLAAAGQALSQARAGRKVAAPLSAQPKFNLPAAVYVCAARPDGRRICDGSVEPQDSLLEAVARHASAMPAGAEDLEISIVSGLRPAKPEEIKPGDGVALEQDGKAAAFLPAEWRRHPQKEDFLSELCSKKAGLARDCWKSAKTALKVFSTQTIAP